MMRSPSRIGRDSELRMPAAAASAPIPAGADRHFRYLVHTDLGCRQITQFVGWIPTSKAIPHTHTVHGIATHAEDDLVLATALSAGTEFLITGDQKFLHRVPGYEGVRLLSPPEFLSLLEAGKTERVTFKVMRAISDALGVPPESIAEFRRVLD